MFSSISFPPQFLLCILAAILGLGRIMGHHENAFKDAAHMFLGVLLGLAVARSHRTLCIILFVGLTVLEVVCAKASGRPITLGNP